MPEESKPYRVNPTSPSPAASVFDAASTLWGGQSYTPYFQNLKIQHRMQVGGSCVSTGLSLLTKEEPTAIRQQVNTQDPVSWSNYLQQFGMKLAYCPTDLRRLVHYKHELLAMDDLFTISTYSSENPSDITRDPNESGWVCGSHFVVLHRNTVFDTRYEQPILLADYEDCQRFVKRLFRVVPADHARGL